MVGFSKLAGSDEERTLARLRALRSDLIDPTIAVHNGRIVKRTGDGVLIKSEASSMPFAAQSRCRMAMIERNAGLPPERRIEFRVGIHLGDVVEESDGDLMGDSVNIAARSKLPPSRGSSLFAKTIATALDRTSLSQVILDGFFARTALDDLPRETRRTGLQEFGLPYASDPVISKHLARFLTRSLQNVQASDKLGALVGSRAGGPALMPTAVLFNGGVFKAGPIRARVLDLLASWNGGQAVRELEGFEPDLAVAQGAAIYGQHRATGKRMRIRPAPHARTMSGWKRRCRPFPGSGRRSRRSASCTKRPGSHWPLVRSRRQARTVN